MSSASKALPELRQAERSLLRALEHVGMARGRRGYLAPTITTALQDVRRAIRNLEAPAAKRRGWPRLARTH